MGLFSGLILLVFVFYIAAVDPKFSNAEPPTVATVSATNINQTSATLNGSISSDGGQPLTIKGFNYGTSQSYGSTSSDTTFGYSYSLKWGSFGTGNGQFDQPEGIARDSNGNIYVVDYNNHRIQKFSSTGTYLDKWGSQGNWYGQFSFPHGIAIDNNDVVYVADSSNNRIQTFDTDGNYLSQFGEFGAGDGQMIGPISVTADDFGNVFVADTLNNRIQKFDNSGSFISKWGTYGSGDGQLSYPFGIATDSSGNVYVTDQYNSRVQKFDNNGVYITKWGSAGTGNNQFNVPGGINIDNNDNVYVVDRGNDRVVKFTNTGTYLSQYGSEGTGDSQLDGPKDVVLDNSGGIYISDENNHRIVKVIPNVSSGAYSLNLTNLSCATTYHFRAFSTNDTETGVGSDSTFTTLDCGAPALATMSAQAASSISQTSATLNGTVVTVGTSPITARGFKYGTTSNYGNTTNDNGTTTGTFSFTANSLLCGTTYYYIAYATSYVGTGNSSQRTFTTSACPTAPSLTTGDPTSISMYSAVLHANLSSIGSSALNTRGFKYGLSSGDYTVFTNDNISATGDYSYLATPLNCNTTYHFISYAANSIGMTHGVDKSFTTLPCPVVVSNQAPIITNQLKVPKSTYTIPAKITFKISVNDDSDIEKVELFKGNDFQGEMLPTSTPNEYQKTVDIQEPGVYSFTSKTTDNGDPPLNTVSTPITITVNDNPEFVGQDPENQNEEATNDQNSQNTNSNSSNNSASDDRVYTPTAIRENLPSPLVGTVESVFKFADRVVTPIPIPAAKALPYTTIAILGVFASIYSYQAFSQAQSRRRILSLARRFKETEERRKTYIDLTSHYLNTPITTMQSSIELLESLKVVPKKTTDPIKKIIKQLTDHAKSLLRLSENLSTESKATTKIIRDASKGHLITSVGFIVPVIGVFIVAIILNLLFVWSKKYSSNIVNILVQTGLYLLGVIGLTASYLLLKRNKVSALTAEQELKLEKDFAESQTKFITDSGSLLYKDVQQIGKYIPKIKDAPHGKTFISGFEALKKAVLKIAYLNRLSTNEHTQKVDSHEIESILNDILLEYQPIALKNLVNLRTSIQPGITAKIDTDGLKQLLTSTLDNAIKFTNDGGDINLSIKELKSGKVSIVVEDTGTGIPKDKIDHLFIPFSRGTDTRKFDYAGLGLDLYMDKLVVDQVGGKISVKSKEGAGTRVSIVLDS